MSKPQFQEQLITNGAETLDEAALLAIILRTGTTNRSIIEMCQEIDYSIKKSHLHITFDDLVSIHGIGTVKACQILSIIELSKRYLGDTTQLTIQGTSDILALTKELQYKTKEYFILICLGYEQKFISKTLISIGTFNATLTHPRDIFREALSQGAQSIIMVHNHPSGNPLPSKSDILITKKIKELGDVLDIKLLDHIIVGKQSHYSFQKEVF